MNTNFAILKFILKCILLKISKTRCQIWYNEWLKWMIHINNFNTEFTKILWNYIIQININYKHYL